MCRPGDSRIGAEHCSPDERRCRFQKSATRGSFARLAGALRHDGLRLIIEGKVSACPTNITYVTTRAKGLRVDVDIIYLKSRVFESSCRNSSASACRQFTTT